MGKALLLGIFLYCALLAGFAYRTVRSAIKRRHQRAKFIAAETERLARERRHARYQARKRCG